jgi:tetratricopeptide (TPR) repeat protein
MARALALFLTLLFTGAIPARAGSQDPRLVLIDSLWSSGHRDSAAALTRRGIVASRSTGDRGLQIDLLTRAGQQNRFFGRAVEGEEHLREAMAMAFDCGDSLRAVAALRWLSLAVGYQGRIEESRRLCDSLLSLSTKLHDERHQGWARVGLAWFASQEGRGEDAIEQYRRAALLFRDSDDPEGEIWASSGLGRALASRGRPKEAREYYRRSAELGRDRRDPIAEANAINDLATIEYSLGDPSLALTMFERALAIHRESGALGETVSPAVNIALCHVVLEQYEAAESVLAETLRLCRARKYDGLAVVVGIHRARLSTQRGLLHESVRRYRDILDQGDGLSHRNRLNTTLGLAEALVSLGRRDEAIVLLEQATDLLSREEEQVLITTVQGALSEALLATGRFEDALRHAEQSAAAARRFGQTPESVEAMALAGRACRALGRASEARNWFIEAAAAWEDQRGVPLDPVWREQRGKSGQVVYTDLASLLIEDAARADGAGDGPRAAFDRLQAFKARTLRERMLGPGEPGQGTASPPVRIVTAGYLQRRVLHRDELLLDYYLGPRNSYLFAITCDSLRVARLPAAEDLRDKLTAYYQVVSAPPASRREIFDPSVLEAAAQRLAHVLFADFGDELGRYGTVMVSGDGILSLLPFEELATHLRGSEGPASSSHATSWVRIPSASILADLRSRRSPPAPSAPHLLVLAGSQSSSGELLRGSDREARGLEHRYRHVDVPPPGTPTDAILRRARSADVIHVAAHLYLDDVSPWHSQVRLGAPGTQVNVDAAQIAAAEIPARLAVLSSCSSAGGRVLSGEGVISVTSAFMSAGVPTVVATLWPVDDLTTARLMECFYERLSKGEPVATALAKAKRTIQSDPATRAPFYWAGFVVVGEGSPSIALVPRRNPAVLILIGLGLAGIVVVMAVMRPFRRTPGKESARPV